MLTFNEEGKCTNGSHILGSVDILHTAYHQIKSNPGNMVHGEDKTTLDKISKEWFTKTSEDLLKDTYRPSPVRRVYIPKANGKLRPIGISNPRDKIVQQAMKMVLEAILEPKFKDSSHGFRPGKGCHTALREIRTWVGVPWLIEGDIKSFFDNIDHHILENLLKKHFDDPLLIHLYWKFVKAGYVEWDNNRKKFIATDFGVPQGSIISPILSNLILNELDSFIEEIQGDLIKTCGKEKTSIRNPTHYKLASKNYRIKKKIIQRSQQSQDAKELREEFQRNLKRLRKMKTTIPNPKMNRIKYVRYADDWIVGVWGTKTYVKQLKEKIKNFLSTLKLELSEDKTFITNTRTNRAKFLGTNIKRIASTSIAKVIRDKNGHAKRIPTHHLWMTFPVNSILERLETRKFMTKKKEHRWRFNSFGHLTVLPIRDIVLRYRGTLNGIFNYYSFVDNKPQLRKIHWILKESLINTIRRKLNIGKRETLKKFGQNVTINYKLRNKTKSIDFKVPDLKRRPMLFVGTSNIDPLDRMNYEIRTIASFGQRCASCNSNENIEMHHVKHIKTINPSLNPFDQMLARINRKQVPLCSKCHDDVHRGRFKGKSLKHWKAN